ncbi:MAG: tRNA (adenosine(37)-N6)-dimethylallyltransferase MiaA [Ilumatobacteraceae bacterium]|nr:tRNA (adenosine(37)-N6)-dimethylallyltransferase MiaA [Ilumatobacteraceae bacterium]
MAVARHLQGRISIVAADAMQVYKRMDIGTAKPLATDRAEVDHFCLDLAEPSERFTVAAFQEAKVFALAEIAQQNKRALVVGGTGLYVTAVVDGLSMPGEWPEIRAELDAIEDIGLLVAELQLRDPVALEKIEPNNKRRLVRALEVCRGSGKEFSSFGSGIANFSASNVRQIGIRWKRDALARRISQRVENMIQGGLVAEVQALLNESEPMSPTARQALGYQEIVDHLEGKVSLDEACDQIVLRTRQFSVRQERWYRRDPRIEWVDVFSDPVGEIAPFVTAALT